MTLGKQRSNPLHLAVHSTGGGQEGAIVNTLEINQAAVKTAPIPRLRCAGKSALAAPRRPSQGRRCRDSWGGVGGGGVSERGTTVDQRRDKVGDVSMETAAAPRLEF